MSKCKIYLIYIDSYRLFDLHYFASETQVLISPYFQKISVNDKQAVVYNSELPNKSKIFHNSSLNVMMHRMKRMFHSLYQTFQHRIFTIIFLVCTILQYDRPKYLILGNFLKLSAQFIIRAVSSCVNRVQCWYCFECQSLPEIKNIFSNINQPHLYFSPSFLSKLSSLIPPMTKTRLTVLTNIS